MNCKSKLITAIALCSIGCLTLGTVIEAQTMDPSLNALVKKGILTEQEAKDALADVEKQKAQQNASTPEPFKTNSQTFVVPYGKEFSLILGGYIQANGELGDASSFEGRFSGGPNQVQQRIRLRRARLGASGDFLRDFDFKLWGDFQQGDGLASNRSGFSAADLFINWHRYEEANLKVGQFLAPYGYEMLIPDVGPNRILLTAERSLVTIAIVPERQVGAQFWGKPLATVAPAEKDLLSYSIGAFNGDNRNIVVNDNSKFMYVGRVDSVPYQGDLWGQGIRWRLGADAFESEDATGTLLSHIGPLRLSTIDGSLSPYTSGSPDERVAWGVDQTLTVGRFEHLEENIRPTTGSPAFHQFTANGYYIQPSYFLLANKLQLVAKWESFNPGQAANDNIRTITGGLNYYIYGQNVIAMLNYMHTWSDFREDNPAAGKSQFNEVLLRLEAFF